MAKLKNEHKLIDAADIDWRYNPNGKNSKDKYFIFRGDVLEMKERGNVVSAHWEKHLTLNTYYWRCSHCHQKPLRDDYRQEVLSEWCPHCGAIMDEKTGGEEDV